MHLSVFQKCVKTLQGRHTLQSITALGPGQVKLSKAVCPNDAHCSKQGLLPTWDLAQKFLFCQCPPSWIMYYVVTLSSIS